MAQRGKGTPSSYISLTETSVPEAQRRVAGGRSAIGRSEVASYRGRHTRFSSAPGSPRPLFLQTRRRACNLSLPFSARVLPTSQGKPILGSGPHITWADDSRYWTRVEEPTSPLGGAWHLIEVCWLSVRATVTAPPPGCYAAFVRVRKPGGGPLMNFHAQWKVAATLAVSAARECRFSAVFDHSAGCFKRKDRLPAGLRAKLFLKGCACLFGVHRVEVCCLRCFVPSQSTHASHYHPHRSL